MKKHIIYDLIDKVNIASAARYDALEKLNVAIANCEVTYEHYRAYLKAEMAFHAAYHLLDNAYIMCGCDPQPRPRDIGYTAFACNWRS